MGRYGDALISFERSFSLVVELGDTYRQAQIMRRSANISKQLGEMEDALEFAISESDSSDFESLADASDGIGNAYIEKGTLDSALFYYLNSMQFRSGLDDPESLHLNYINIGLVYQIMGDYPKAKDYIQRKGRFLMPGNSKMR